MTATSILLGGAIHDVAQVVGAGFAVSPDVGVSAVALKLRRLARSDGFASVGLRAMAVLLSCDGMGQRIGLPPVTATVAPET